MIGKKKAASAELNEKTDIKSIKGKSSKISLIFFLEYLYSLHKKFLKKQSF